MPRSGGGVRQAVSSPTAMVDVTPHMPDASNQDMPDASNQADGSDWLAVAGQVLGVVTILLPVAGFLVRWAAFFSSTSGIAMPAEVLAWSVPLTQLVFSGAIVLAAALSIVVFYGFLATRWFTSKVPLLKRFVSGDTRRSTSKNPFLAFTSWPEGAGRK